MALLKIEILLASSVLSASLLTWILKLFCNIQLSHIFCSIINFWLQILETLYVNCIIIFYSYQDFLNIQKDCSRAFFKWLHCIRVCTDLFSVLYPKEVPTCSSFCSYFISSEMLVRNQLKIILILRDVFQISLLLIVLLGTPSNLNHLPFKRLLSLRLGNFPTT